MPNGSDIIIKGGSVEVVYEDSVYPQEQETQTDIATKTRRSGAL